MKSREVETIDDEPFFVGKDVAEILGYAETAKAIREHVDEDDKGVSVLDTPGGKQKMTIINESGLYSRPKFRHLVLKVANLSTLTS